MNIFSGHFWSFSVCRNQEIINDTTFRGAVVWCVVSTMNTPCWWYSGSWHSGAGSYFHNVTALSCGHLHNPVLLSSTHHRTVSAVSRVGWHPLIMGLVSEEGHLNTTRQSLNRKVKCDILDPLNFMDRMSDHGRRIMKRQKNKMSLTETKSRV